MKRNFDWLANTIFWIGFIIVMWDFYETVLNANDTPYRLHHAWYGFIFLALAWIYQNRKQIIKMFMVTRRNGHGTKVLL